MKRRCKESNSPVWSMSWVSNHGYFFSIIRGSRRRWRRRWSLLLRLILLWVLRPMMILLAIHVDILRVVVLILVRIPRRDLRRRRRWHVSWIDRHRRSVMMMRILLTNLHLHLMLIQQHLILVMQLLLILMKLMLTHSWRKGKGIRDMNRSRSRQVCISETPGDWSPHVCRRVMMKEMHLGCSWWSWRCCRISLKDWECHRRRKWRQWGHCLGIPAPTRRSAITLTTVSSHAY